jgi:hypothetical protein
MYTASRLEVSPREPVEACGALELQMIPAALDRICASAAFRNAERLISFLRFVVMTTLAKGPTTIKAYSVAIDGLGLPLSFDPDRSPLVRVTARRVRQALIAYYTDEGRGEPILIEIPPGAYVPKFLRRAVGSSVIREDALSSNSAPVPWFDGESNEARNDSAVMQCHVELDAFVATREMLRAQLARSRALVMEIRAEVDRSRFLASGRRTPYVPDEAL